MDQKEVNITENNIENQGIVEVKQSLRIHYIHSNIRRQERSTRNKKKPAIEINALTLSNSTREVYNLFAGSGGDWL